MGIMLGNTVVHFDELIHLPTILIKMIVLLEVILEIVLVCFVDISIGLLLEQFFLLYIWQFEIILELRLIPFITSIFRSVSWTSDIVLQAHHTSAHFNRVISLMLQKLVQIVIVSSVVQLRVISRISHYLYQLSIVLIFTLFLLLVDGYIFELVLLQIWWKLWLFWSWSVAKGTQAV